MDKVINEEFYKSIIKESSTGYASHKIVFDDKGIPNNYVFLEVNKAFETITGLKESNIIGKRVTDIMPDILDDSFDWINYYGEIAVNGNNKNFDQFSATLNKWYRVNVFSPMKNHFVTIFYDITQEKSQLEENQNFFNVNLDLLCIANLDGYLIKINKQWENTLGYTIGELENKRFLDYVHKEDLKTTLEIIEKLSNQEQVMSFTNRYKCKDGTYKYIEWRAQPQGQLIYAAARDITERIIEENALKQLVAMSEDFLQFFNKTLDYQKITDDFLIMTGSKIAAFNLYDEDGKMFATMALSADKGIIKRGTKIFGGKVQNRRWPHDPIREEMIKDRIITTFPSLFYFAGHNLSKTTIEFLNRVFNLGEVVIVKILKNNIMLGDFTLIMPKGKSFTKHFLAEAYSRQLGLVISKKRAEDALVKSEEKYRLITENASDIIWEYNLTKEKFSYISPSVEHILGYTVEEAMKHNMMQLLSPQSLEIVNKLLSERLNIMLENPDNSTYVTEIQQSSKNGKPIWTEVSVKVHKNSDGELEIIGVSRDIEERKKSENRILYLSYNDQLTDVYNRRFFEEKIIEMNIIDNFPLTLIMLDVNGLKLINDAFGHMVGDKVLRRAADIMKKECRKDDIIARIGGDEFVIILPKTSSDEAEILIKTIYNRIIDEKVGSINLSVSYGWETKTRIEQDIMEVLKEAENYMYRQKLSESQSARNKTIEVIIKTLYEKSPREESHSKRVGKLCAEIGAAMGFSQKEVNELGTLGLMHDIGKIAIDDEILNKQSSLNRSEWIAMKRHSEIGYRILSAINEYAQSAEYVLAHHERWDGKGYPKSLKGEDIPLESRIIALADAYDAMTSNRTYRTAMTKQNAIDEIERNIGTQFDPNIARVFIDKVLTNL